MNSVNVLFFYAYYQPILYRCFVGTNTPSPKDFEILRVKCIGITTFTFHGHVMISDVTIQHALMLFPIQVLH